nr:D-alanyl-D-alanine carboxypeptidase [Lachnospiraceae bacterium]
PSQVDVSAIRDWPTGPEVAAQGAVLIEAETGTVLYSKNMNQRFYPASTTKILSTLVAIENARLDEMVSFSNEAVFSIERGSSNMGMDVGQQITMEQCLYGILVYSANEVANAVAEHVSGDIDSFVGKMNAKAAELGCVNSHFVTTNGLHDENHYTTPYDLAQIGRAFFANETLAKISGTRYYKIDPTDKQPDLIELYTHNKLTNNTYPYEGYVGGKTGYTTIANQTLISCAKRNDMTLICVVMSVDSPGQYTDTIALFDYGFHNFSKVNVSEKEKKYTLMNSDFFIKEGQIFGQSEAIMSMDPTDTIVLPATIDFDMLQSQLKYVDDPKSPDSVAVIQYSYENMPLGSANILLAQDQPPYDFESPNVQPDPGSETGKSVVFINVIKTLLIILCIFAGILLLIFLRKYIKEFNFSAFKRRKYMFKDTSKKWTVRMTEKIKENAERRKRRKRYRRRKKF